MPRYRFSEFILSPRRRVLVRNGRQQPLIPRYFDLLVACWVTTLFFGEAGL
ncbi:MAG: hypothetical protein ACRD2X_28160 [Vicinamibacteraceae bacterium]